jgi:predicted transposase/invertase (TIGR01784 family)
MPYVTSIERMAAEKGRIEGEVSARIATQREIALNLLRQNIAVDVIVQTTGLTIDQVQALQAN